MFKPQAPSKLGSQFSKDYEYDEAKRQERKADKQRRQARKGKRVMWGEAND